MCGKVGHKHTKCRSGGGDQTGNKGQTADVSSQASTALHQELGRQKSTGPTLDKGTTVSQRIRSQDGALTSGPGVATATKAVFTAGEQEDSSQSRCLSYCSSTVERGGPNRSL